MQIMDVFLKNTDSFLNVKPCLSQWKDSKSKVRRFDRGILMLEDMSPPK